MFSIFLTVTKERIPDSYIVASTYFAKVISCAYSFFVNKNLVFGNKDKKLSVVLKYLFLCGVQASLSGMFTDVLVEMLKWNEVLSKIVIDTFLFFISFQVQNRWVFGEHVSKN